MKRQQFRFFSQKITKNFLAKYAIAASGVLLLLSSGCVNKSQEEVQLEIRGVERENSAGLYKVSGSTNLPESSRIVVTAVRYLRPNTANTETEEILDDDKGNINRSILARQIVEVKQGKWEADLNLWKVGSKGNFQETWQLNQDFKKFSPESEVSFIATFNPVGQLPISDKQTSQQSTPQYQQLEGKTLRFTNEGEKYVQASEYRSIALPVGGTTPPRPKPEDFNGGWGNRYQIKSQPKNSRSNLPRLSKSEQTNSPLLTSEFLR